MTAPESRFAKLAKRMERAEERERLLEAQKHLKLGDDDALWDLIIVLQIYDGWFRQTPSAVRLACKGVINDASSAVKAALDDSVRDVEARLQVQVERIEAAARTFSALQANLLGVVIVSFVAMVMLTVLAAALFRVLDRPAQDLSGAAALPTVAARADAGASL